MFYSVDCSLRLDLAMTLPPTQTTNCSLQYAFAVSRCRDFKFQQRVHCSVSLVPPGCFSSLTAGSSSCRSNVNWKLQKGPQDRGHVTLSALHFPIKKPDAKQSRRTPKFGALVTSRFYCIKGLIITKSHVMKQIVTNKMADGKRSLLFP